MGQPLKGGTTFGSLVFILRVIFMVVGCCVCGSASLSSRKGGSGFVHELCDNKLH